MKVEPLPCPSDSARMVPPCASTICFAMHFLKKCVIVLLVVFGHPGHLFRNKFTRRRIVVVTHKRIASSDIAEILFGDTSRQRDILKKLSLSLVEMYGGETSLPEQFKAIPNRIICICPMVLCEALLSDLSLEAPDVLLGGVGLAMYSISTHDDIVDEHPEGQELIASLIYAGNIASLHGISLLVSNGYTAVALKVIHLMNLNHCFQRNIVSSLWVRPSDEHGYLKAIAHTGYWASIGTVSATVYANRSDLEDFSREFGRYYGRMCQVYDDIREIDDDLRNGYFHSRSAPLSDAGTTSITPQIVGRQS